MVDAVTSGSISRVAVTLQRLFVGLVGTSRKYACAVVIAGVLFRPTAGLLGHGTNPEMN